MEGELILNTERSPDSGFWRSNGWLCPHRHVRLQQFLPGDILTNYVEGSLCSASSLAPVPS